MRDIRMIVVHCTGTPEGTNVTVESIDRQHKSLGWKGIGYHWVVYIDGSVHKGRDEKEMGAHASGFNARSIGICYVGGLDKNNKCKDTRTDAQKKALITLIKEIKERHKGIENVLGHNELPGVKKCCPCFSAKNEYKDI